MSNDQFVAHGSVSASYDVDEKILYLNLTGPFNIEFMTAYEAEVGPIRGQITSPCWASIVSVYGLALAPMNAIEPARAIVEQAVADGLTATAVLFHNQESASTQRKFWTEMYAQTNVNYKFFDDMRAARHWLQTEIDKCLAKLAEKSPIDTTKHSPSRH